MLYEDHFKCEIDEEDKIYSFLDTSHYDDETV